LARIDVPVVVDIDFGDRAGQARRHQPDGAVDVSVVGRDVAHVIAIVAQPRNDGGEQRDHHDCQQQTPDQ